MVRRDDRTGKCQQLPVCGTAGLSADPQRTEDVSVAGYLRAVGAVFLPHEAYGADMRMRCFDLATTTGTTVGSTRPAGPDFMIEIERVAGASQ